MRIHCIESEVIVPISSVQHQGYVELLIQEMVLRKLPENHLVNESVHFFLFLLVQAARERSGGSHREKLFHLPAKINFILPFCISIPLLELLPEGTLGVAGLENFSRTLPGHLVPVVCVDLDPIGAILLFLKRIEDLIQGHPYSVFE